MTTANTAAARIEAALHECRAHLASAIIGLARTGMGVDNGMGSAIGLSDVERMRRAISNARLCLDSSERSLSRATEDT